MIAELLRRGHSPVAIGRDPLKIAACRYDVEKKVASLDDPESLDRALRDVQAVINCAGPFLDSSKPLIEAALSAGIHYADVTAEQESARLTLGSFDTAARRRNVAILPAAGFFGGLGDLLATAAMGDWKHADRIDIAIALDSWRPTTGTRLTGVRNTIPRVVRAGGNFTPLQPSSPKIWNFREPFETQEVVEVPLTETILISAHLNVLEIHNYMNQAPLRDLSDLATPTPVAADELGRSNQVFTIDAVVRNGSEERRARARGRDIYAVTAPIVVEAAERLCEGGFHRAGTFALADLFDASEFLHALTARGDLIVETD